MDGQLLSSPAGPDGAEVLPSDVWEFPFRSLLFAGAFTRPELR